MYNESDDGIQTCNVFIAATKSAVLPTELFRHYKKARRGREAVIVAERGSQARCRHPVLRDLQIDVYLSGVQCCRPSRSQCADWLKKDAVSLDSDHWACEISVSHLLKHKASLRPTQVSQPNRDGWLKMLRLSLQCTPPPPSSAVCRRSALQTGLWQPPLNHTACPQTTRLACLLYRALLNCQTFSRTWL
jgi:hypothetical protein